MCTNQSSTHAWRKKRREREGTWRGNPDAHLYSCTSQLMYCLQSSNTSTGFTLSSKAFDQCNYHWRDTSWPNLWEQRVPERPCGPTTATTSLIVEMAERTCLPNPEIWQSGSLSGRPSIGWCLLASWNTKPCWTAQGLTSPYWRQPPGPCRAARLTLDLTAEIIMQIQWANPKR